jgi:hypothetical protein
MEPISTSTVISGAGATLKGIEHGIKGWGWLKKKIWGMVEITEPANLQVWTKQWMTVKGTHKGRKRGHFWLMTSRGSEYWAQGEVKFQHNGTWSGDVNLGLRPGPKQCIILIVWVDTTIDRLLKDIDRRIRFAHKLIQDHNLDGQLAIGCWSPIDLGEHSGRSFSIMAHRTIQFPEGPVQH